MVIAGAGIEPARKRLMRPLPSHLATPQLLEIWHGVSVPPRAGEVLETPLRKLAPAVSLENLVRSAGIAPASPGWHPGILLLKDDRERAARVLATTAHPRRIRQKRTNTAASRALTKSTRHTRWIYSADLSVFTGTPPTKPL